MGLVKREFVNNLGILTAFRLKSKFSFHLNWSSRELPGATKFPLSFFSYILFNNYSPKAKSIYIEYIHSLSRGE